MKTDSKTWLWWMLYLILCAAFLGVMCRERAPAQASMLHAHSQQCRSTFPFQLLCLRSETTTAFFFFLNTYMQGQHGRAQDGKSAPSARSKRPACCNVRHLAGQGVTRPQPPGHISENQRHLGPLGREREGCESSWSFQHPGGPTGSG